MLTTDQIASFHANGFLRMRGIFRGRELALLRAAGDRVQEEALARRGVEHLYAGEVWRRSERMWDRDPIFRAATVNPELLENIGQCIGEAFYPWNDSMVVKMPDGGAPVAWHQDPPYGDPARERTHPVPNFTTDIYLDQSTIANGCVWAIPGHHLVGHVPLQDHDQEALFAHPAAVPVEMEPGDVLFHALSTPHGSRVNRSATSRRTFYVHYLSEEVRADCYATGWAASKGGWDASRRERLRGMIADRAALGLNRLESTSCPLGSEGFTPSAALASTPRAWAALERAIPDGRRQAMKRLEARTVAAAR